MAEVDIGIERKRRLPMWMLGVTAADELSAVVNKNQRSTSSGDQSSSQATSRCKASHTKRPEKKIINNDEQASERDSGSLVRGKTRERTRRSRKQDIALENSIAISSKFDPNKKKSKVVHAGESRSIRKRAAPKKKKARSCEPENSDEIEAELLTEDLQNGVELTMEDLMSMAEEYVNADKDKECQQAVTTEPKSKALLPDTSVFSLNKSVASLQATESAREMHTYTTERLTSGLNKAGEKDKEISKSESVAINPSRTGDPAQYMLDLFLGPLLKKPHTEGRKLNSITEELAFTCEFGKYTTNQVPLQEAAPLMKKKGTLKDKVAMFLD